MKINPQYLSSSERPTVIKHAVSEGLRLGLITSIDGSQLITLMLNSANSELISYETPLSEPSYHCLTLTIPQAHWMERTTWDFFGLNPQGHPRLKHTHLHDAYDGLPPPFAPDNSASIDDRQYRFMEVDGEGVYEIPVGPIHAGIIEPGHFRFSCYGEVILNLEIRLGYVHRGIEKRMTEIPWKNGRFLAEASASDMPVANALAHSVALESLLSLSVNETAIALRGIALEVERIAMHLSDLAGLAQDIGFLGIASSLSRLRGITLRIGEIISGNRLMKNLICPGGLTRGVSADGKRQIVDLVKQLRNQFLLVSELYTSDQVALDRMENIGKISRSLAAEFGLVGVAARASGIDYDCRTYWNNGLPKLSAAEICVEKAGDVYARAKVRMREVLVSLEMVERLIENVSDEPTTQPLPEQLPENSVAAAVVESHRGELIHLVFTDAKGGIKRYCIKDPSVNNWTGLSIAIRNNLVADFPLCNKSFSLSYGGHDL
jgi:Ni,Fe-hydrogenase III large subunit